MTQEEIKQNKIIRLSFEEAKKIVHSLGFKSRREYCKSGNKPENMPSHPERAYKKEWKGWGDWLGTGRTGHQPMEFLPFEQARRFARSLGIKSERKWRKWCKSENRRMDIPSSPHVVYEKEWKGWGDWLGTDTKAAKDRKYWPFLKAREYVRSLGLKSIEEWYGYCKSGKRPDYIPYNLYRTYKDEWKGWGDWLGTGNTANQNREFWPFPKAREYVHSLGLKNRREYHTWSKSRKRPDYIPANPNQTYKNEWKGLGDWLGTNFWPFPKAREYVHSLGLRSQREWKKYCKSGNKPDYIPTHPKRVYKKECKGMGDWLGTGTIAPQNKEFLPFEEARKIVHSFALKNADEWETWRKSEKRPKNIPTSPNVVYKNEWRGLPDWLGYEDPDWSVRRVKELLRDWIERGSIYEEEDIVLYSLLSANGLLNLQNRHAQFFKNLIEARSTTEGLEAIKEYAYSDSEEPPELEGNGVLPDEELGTASTEEIADLVKNETDPLDYGKIKPIEQLLRSTERLDSYTEDIEKMQFFISKNIKDWWSRAFADEEGTVAAAKNEEEKGKYHDAVIETFLSDHKGAKSIEPPEGYAFKKNGEIQKLKLMQQYVAYKIKTNRRFGNFSGTGAGKTLSAIVSSRVVDSKMTVIICPNAVVDQWRGSIKKTFPDSVVIPRMAAFHEKYEDNKHKYLVINYDLFSQPLSSNWVLELGKQKIDFIVLDEIHFTKRRSKEQSKRRAE